VILQIAHGGGQANAKPQNKDMLAPSNYKFPLSICKARAMTHHEIEEVINDFVTAIVRAKKAGYDGVQVHCAHGYLLSQFLSPKINRRKDQWGGSLINRFQIIKEIFTRARKEVGDFPLWAKISAYSLDKGNITLQEAIETAQLLENARCDLVEISCGTFLDGMSTARCQKAPVQAYMRLVERVRNANPIVKLFLSTLMPLMVPCPKPIENYNVESAIKIKERVTIPVCVVGGLRDKDTIEALVENNSCDLISLSRPLIIEPNLVKRFRDKQQEKSRCINCNFCLIGCFEQPVKCYYGKIK
jgi:2,4-dienoyl-CoA reductase-like NADH-dependent reductase (Old Yellow Enzyme family)